MAPKILWIDDDIFQSTHLQQMLENRGFQIEYAISALDGYKKMISKKYNLIIIDLILPLFLHSESIPDIVKDWTREPYLGIGIAKWASLNLGSHCPIIICSVINDPINRFRLQEYKIAKAFSKIEPPNVVADELLEIIREFKAN